MAAFRSCGACGRGRVHSRTLPFIIAAVLLGAMPAHAHDETVSASDVLVDGARVRWRVDVGIDGLRKIVPFSAGPVNENDLAVRAVAIGRYVSGGLRVVADGQTLDGQVSAVRPVFEPYVPTGVPGVGRVEVVIVFAAVNPVDELRARVTFFADVTPRHRAVVDLRWQGQEAQAAPRSFVLLGTSELVVHRAAARAEWASRLAAFLGWGAYHIFTGYDHLAFLLALLVTSWRPREVVKLVTAFTAAHSITLLLAALDVVCVPSRITEAAIAASIVYVAADNLFRRRAPAGGGAPRWPLTFGFGLVHGLGFASALHERLVTVAGDAPPSLGRLVVPVLTFNLGIELGQLAVVAAVLPIFALLRSRGQDASRRMVALTSTPILVVGLYWLVQRVTS